MNLTDKSHCPLCGEANQCAITQGKTIEQCWCFTTDIKPQALDAIEAPLKGNVCICPNCATVATPTTHNTKRNNDER
ncbi:MAG: hypothetical protein ACJA0N_002223 [Pseudohongiellaceae bacterium]|jgi:hypothetical protein